MARPGLMRRRQGRTSLRRFDGELLPFGPLLTELSNGRRTNAVAGHRLHSSCRRPAVSKSASLCHGGEESKGVVSASFTDGREIIVPISFFPDIKELQIKERNKWMILDDQFFTFKSLSRVFSITDLLGAA